MKLHVFRELLFFAFLSVLSFSPSVSHAKRNALSALDLNDALNQARQYLTQPGSGSSIDSNNNNKINGDNVNSNSNNGRNQNGGGGGIRGARALLSPFLNSKDPSVKNDPNLHNILGYIAESLGDHAEAMERYGQVVVSAPHFAAAHSSLGNVKMAIGQINEAISHYSKAIEVAKINYENDPGSARKPRVRRPKFGLTSRKLSSSDSNSEDSDTDDDDDKNDITGVPAVYYYNRGLARFQVRSLYEAARDYECALAIDPNNEAAANNLGVTLMTMERFSDAIAAYRMAFKARKSSLPDPRTYFNEMLCLNRVAGDWENYIDNQRKLVSLGGAATPFNCFEFSVYSPVDCFKISKNFVSKLVAEVKSVMDTKGGTLFDISVIKPPRAGSKVLKKDGKKSKTVKTKSKKKRLRVAYLHSSGFHESTTTARLLVSMFPLHDRKRLRIMCLAMARDDRSITRAEIARGCESFEQVPEDQIAAAKAVYARRPHILVDIAGLTIMPIAKILKTKPAPIQVSFHGFPGSSSQKEVDYLITDVDTSPPIYSRVLYMEKLVYMPHTYFATSYKQRHREVFDASLVPSRSSVSLPETGFVYCTFNQFYKVTPNLFVTWMNILRAVPDSVLWLMTFSEDAIVNLRKHAMEQGVEPSRLIFAPKFPRNTEYPTKSLCGLHLDAPLFNAHSTMTDVLWSGVPSVTLPGGAGFAARAASGIVRAAGLADEMIVDTLEEYERVAVRMGTDEAWARNVTRKLRDNRDVVPLFDTARFTRNIDEAWMVMWEVYRRGKGGRGGKPMHILISDQTPSSTANAPDNTN